MDLETYEGLRLLVHKIAQSFYRRWGATNAISLEDVIQEANALCLEAHQCYDPTKETKLSSWVYYYISSRLRKRLWVKPRTGLSNASLERQPQRVRFDAEAFARELSEDGRQTVFLVLDLPEDARVPDGHRRLAATASHPRTILRHLLKKQGWGKQRIQRTFAEIQDALNS
jgi:hypothetical protein